VPGEERGRDTSRILMMLGWSRWRRIRSSRRIRFACGTCPGHPGRVRETEEPQPAQDPLRLRRLAERVVDLLDCHLATAGGRVVVGVLRSPDLAVCGVGRGAAASRCVASRPRELS